MLCKVWGLFEMSLCLLQTECDLEKGLEMRKWVLSGILATEEMYLSHLEALLLVRTLTLHVLMMSCIIISLPVDWYECQNICIYVQNQPNSLHSRSPAKHLLYLLSALFVLLSP